MASILKDKVMAALGKIEAELGLAAQADLMKGRLEKLKQHVEAFFKREEADQPAAEPAQPESASESPS